MAVVAAVDFADITACVFLASDAKKYTCHYYRLDSIIRWNNVDFHSGYLPINSNLLLA